MKDTSKGTVLHLVDAHIELKKLAEEARQEVCPKKRDALLQQAKSVSENAIKKSN